MLWIECGLGKTAITLHYLAFESSIGDIKATLVLAPLQVIRNVWPAEVSKWLISHHLRISTVHGADKDKALFETEADLYLMNYEGLLWLKQALYGDVVRRKGKRVTIPPWRTLDELPFNCIVYDEITRVKDTKTKRFKVLKRLLGSRRITHSVGLTGTPVANHYQDLFGQVYAVDAGAAYGQSFYKWRYEYFLQTDYRGYQFALRESKKPELMRRIAPMTYQVEGRLDLPQVHEVRRALKLPRGLRKVYDTFKKQMIVTLKNKKLVALSAASLMSKCHQVAQGAIYHYHEQTLERLGDDYDRLHDEKLEALRSVIEEAQGNPVLVAYHFHHDLERLRAAFPGGVLLTSRGFSQAAWDSGDIEIGFAHPQSAAHGLNLQAGGHQLFWFSLTTSYELYYQMIRRFVREGQKADRVTVHLPYMESTTDDEVMLPALARKMTNEREIVKLLKEVYL